MQFATSAGPVQLTKPHIFESDLHDTAARAASPHFRRLFDSDALVARLNELAPALQLGLGSANRTIKLQHNTGGGAFPWHYDNPARPNKRSVGQGGSSLSALHGLLLSVQPPKTTNRRVTYLVYLNPDWKEGDGGEVALLPFLGKQVVVPPLFNRVVMFLSDRMLHRVLPASGWSGWGVCVPFFPSRRPPSPPRYCCCCCCSLSLPTPYIRIAPRFCFTIWIDSDEVCSTSM